jgi:hypothetical protein
MTSPEPLIEALGEGPLELATWPRSPAESILNS